MALDLPGEARAEIAGWRERALAGRRELRPVAPEALHVTLVFLGWQDVAAVDAIEAALRAACSGRESPLLRPAGVVAVPPRKPRLFALDLEDASGVAGSLQASVSSAFEAGGWYVDEKRPFWPHVTLARVRRGQHEAAPLADEPGPPSAPFAASVVTLYRSTLRPQGAQYEALARVVL